MRRALAIITALSLIFLLSACGQNTSQANVEESKASNKTEAAQDGKILVAYFSATGNTKQIAEQIADINGGEIFEIVPSIPYTEADLNYNSDCRANREQNDKSSRPEINGGIDNFDAYDIIFLGYPIWWGTCPRITATFLESYDFTGKTVIPFCTSGSSGIEASLAEIKTLIPEAVVNDGKRFSSNDKNEAVNNWLNSLNIKGQEDKEMTKITVKCGDRSLEIELADNKSAKAFVEKLEQGDVTVKMSDYGDFEKVGELGFDLPKSDESISTSAGDVILYLGNKIVIYYGENDWNFTRIGKIPDMTREKVLDFLGGKGEATVTFSIA